MNEFKKILLIILKWRKLQFSQVKDRADYITCPFIQFFRGEIAFFFYELPTYMLEKKDKKV